jgi:hypothetical protein
LLGFPLDIKLLCLELRIGQLHFPPRDQAFCRKLLLPFITLLGQSQIVFVFLFLIAFVG